MLLRQRPQDKKGFIVPVAFVQEESIISAICKDRVSEYRKSFIICSLNCRNRFALHREASLDHDELERQFHVFLSTLFSHLAVIITNHASYASVAKATGKEGLYCSRQYSPFRKFHFLLLIFLLYFPIVNENFQIWHWHLMRKNPLFKQSLQTSTAIVLHEVVTLFQEHGLVVEDFITIEPHKRNRSHYANLAPYGFLLCTMMSWSMKNGFHDLQPAYNLAEA
ncbi:hypothetical protein E3N88_45142 [Mikania micrantha]|uniref:Uncharacterized protein n=1 Tax=Mikania micrantha TaxID=192012 RepID=A0A5N6LAM0_9ASTR|nr:hypothetical protein E3N88_45142 [Mikania micrantha]